MKKKNYDTGLMGRAISGLGLRVIVAAYIVYMGWKVLSGALNGGSPIPEWGAWAIFSVFVAAMIAFGVFAVKQFVLLLRSAKISSAPNSSGSNSGSLSDSNSVDSDNF